MSIARVPIMATATYEEMIQGKSRLWNEFTQSLKKEQDMNNDEVLGEVELRWSEEAENWCLDEGAGVDMLCGDGAGKVIPKEFKQPGKITMTVIAGQPSYEGPGIAGRRFMVQGVERVMLETSRYDIFESIPIFDELNTWLKDGVCGCTPGVIYTVVFEHARATPRYVTKRRKLTIDIEVTCELDEDGRPVTSPGAILFEEGNRIIDRLKTNPHMFSVTPKHWNVDHVRIGDGEVVDKHNDDYMKFNDRPGVWDCDRIWSRDDE